MTSGKGAGGRVIRTKLPATIEAAAGNGGISPGISSPALAHWRLIRLAPLQISLGSRRVSR